VAVVADLGYRYAKTVLEMNSRILDILFFGLRGRNATSD